MIKGVFFDCYGTIISTGNGSVEAVKKILDSKDIKINAETFYKHWKIIHKDNQKNLIEFKNEKDIFIEDLRILYDHYNIKGNVENDIIHMLNSLYKRSFYNDSINCIKKLKENYKIYIASNSDTEPLLENIGKNNYLFDGIFTSEDLRAYKPSIQFLEKIVKITGFEYNEIIYVGDSLVDDISGAQKLSIYTVLIDRKNEYKENEIIPDSLINNLNELEEIINKVNKKRGYCT